MTDVSISKNTLNIMRGAITVLVIAVLLLVYNQIVSSAPNPNNFVEVIIDERPLAMPKGFQSALQERGIASIALVNKTGQLRAVSTDGKPLDLCGRTKKGTLSPETCKYETAPQTLLSRLSGGSNCYTCISDTGTPYTCHASGRYPCHPGSSHTQWCPC